MPKIYRTANGRIVDVERLLLTNDHVIAIGNQKVNARGDELGAGGKVIKTKDQIMKEYYALNTPVAKDIPLDPVQVSPNSGLDAEDNEPAPEPAKKMRGALANSVIKK